MSRKKRDSASTDKSVGMRNVTAEGLKQDLSEAL